MMPTTTLQAITTRDEIESFVEANADMIEAGEVFVRWSHGPERDEANGWVSRNWASEGDEEYEGEAHYDGLCATKVWDATVNDVVVVARMYKGQVHGETCYILSGRACGECPDGEPIVEYVEPLAIIAPSALA